MSSVVPEGWRARLFGDLAKVINGYAFKGSDFVEKSETSVPIIRMSSLKAGTIDLSDAVYVAKNNVKGLEKFLLNSGDFVFGMSGSISNFAIIKEKDGICYQNQRVGRLSPINASSGFLSQLFLSESVSRQIEGLAAGGAQLNISSSQIENLNILSPPLPEQKKIASILTSVDEVIENTQKQIDKLQDLKKATMNELLTKGIGHTEFKDSELGRIPKSWEVMKLGVFAKVKGGKRLPKGEQFSETMTEYPYIRVSDFENQGINKTHLKYVSGRVRESIKRYVISSKDLYISIAGSIGIIGTIPDELSGSLLTENAAKIVLESNVITRDFLKCNLSSEIAQSQFRQEKGTGGGVPKLALFRIEETLVALPKIDEQLQISSTIASLDKAISDVDSKLSQTQSLKKSLMQDLLTGKVRVAVN